jgi:saccharopine dehydrogenase-like NADP-dependent oxidoreductase
MSGPCTDAIVVLGGAGDMGSKVVEEIAIGLNEDRELWKSEWRRSVCRHLVVADIDREAAERVTRREQEMPGREGFTALAVQADAANPRRLADLLAGARVVVNCVGPFYRYAPGVLAAAVRAGVTYVDICDDDDATVHLLDMDGMARREGVRARIGMGWTPGISNLLAAHGVKAIRRSGDSSARIAITRVGSAADAAGTAVVEHVFHAITRPVPVFRDGAWDWEPAGTGIREVRFPRPFGPVRAYYPGHLEPITLPRYLRDVAEVEVRGYWLPDDLQNLSRAFINLGLLDSDRKLHGLTELLHPFLPVLAGLGKTPAPALSAVRVDIRGESVSLSYIAVDTMRRLTGILPAVTALTLAGVPDPPASVYPPEGTDDAESLLSHLRRRGVQEEDIS